jgi:hypothetical protein
MRKKSKIVYFAVMAINSIVCVVDIVIGDYDGAILCGITLAWLISTYFLVQKLYYAHAELERLYNEFYESAKRESIRQQEFDKMRDRAQDAEKRVKELENVTPARGKDGRFTKRNSQGATLTNN